MVFSIEVFSNSVIIIKNHNKIKIYNSVFLKIIIITNTTGIVIRNSNLTDLSILNALLIPLSELKNDLKSLTNI